MLLHWWSGQLVMAMLTHKKTLTACLLTSPASTGLPHVHAAYQVPQLRQAPFQNLHLPQTS